MPEQKKELAKDALNALTLIDSVNKSRAAELIEKIKNVLPAPSTSKIAPPQTQTPPTSTLSDLTYTTTQTCLTFLNNAGINERVVKFLCNSPGRWLFEEPLEGKTQEEQKRNLWIKLLLHILEKPLYIALQDSSLTQNGKLDIINKEPSASDLLKEAAIKIAKKITLDGLYTQTALIKDIEKTFQVLKEDKDKYPNETKRALDQIANIQLKLLYRPTLVPTSNLPQPSTTLQPPQTSAKEIKKEEAQQEIVNILGNFTTREILEKTKNSVLTSHGLAPRIPGLESAFESLLKRAKVLANQIENPQNLLKRLDAITNALFEPDKKVGSLTNFKVAQNLIAKIATEFKLPLIASELPPAPNYSVPSETEKEKTSMMLEEISAKLKGLKKGYEQLTGLPSTSVMTPIQTSPAATQQNLSQALTNLTTALNTLKKELDSSRKGPILLG